MSKPLTDKQVKAIKALRIPQFRKATQARSWSRYLIFKTKDSSKLDTISIAISLSDSGITIAFEPHGWTDETNFDAVAVAIGTIRQALKEIENA